MENPSKSRELSDSTIYHGEDQQNSNNQETNAPVSVPPPASQLLLRANHPTDIVGYGGGANQLTTLKLPTAYPYDDAQQGKKEASATWVFNAGNNINMKGKQRVGGVIVGNTSNGAPLPINFPQNGRFIINVGGNINDGGLQETGIIMFGNARRG